MLKIIKCFYKVRSLFTYFCGGMRLKYSAPRLRLHPGLQIIQMMNVPRNPSVWNSRFEHYYSVRVIVKKAITDVYGEISKAFLYYFFDETEGNTIPQNIYIIQI